MDGPSAKNWKKTNKQTNKQTNSQIKLKSISESFVPNQEINYLDFCSKPNLFQVWKNFLKYMMLANKFIST